MVFCCLTIKLCDIALISEALLEEKFQTKKSVFFYLGTLLDGDSEHEGVVGLVWVAAVAQRQQHHGKPRQQQG